MEIRNKFIGTIFLLAIFVMLLCVAVPADYQLLKQSFSNFSELKSLITSYTNSDSDHLVGFAVGKRWGDRIMGLDMTASMTAGKEYESAAVGDFVAVWQDDYLGYVIPDADNTLLMESIADFGKQMEKEHRNFLLFIPPAKWAQNIAYPDYTQKRRSQFLQKMREHGLDIIDVMEVITERQIDIKDLFFKTDHHWLPSAGIWADQLLCEFMNQKYAYCIDTSIFDPENYDTIVYEDSILGSLGRKVTTAYCEKEDFPVIIPKYDTNLEVYISIKDEIYTGSIQDTLFDYERLEASISNIYSDYNDGADAYNSYGYGDQALVAVHNNNIHDGSCLLVIRNSFGDVMIPYLSAAAEDLYALDLRHFNGNLRAFINETDPDTVVIVTTYEDAFGFSRITEN